MLFQEALKQMEAGKSMRRKPWSAEDGYVCLMRGMKYVWKIVLHPAPNAGNYIFSVEDFLAKDWKEFEVSSEDFLSNEERCSD